MPRRRSPGQQQIRGKKLTGKELWERGLVGKGDDEGEEGEDGLDVEKLKIEA